MCLLWIRASSKRLAARRGAPEERIKYGALTEQRIIPGASRRTMNCCGAGQSTTSRTEHHGKGQSTFSLHFLIDLCYLFIIFWDSFYHSMVLLFLIFLLKKWFPSGLYNLLVIYFLTDSRKKCLWTKWSDHNHILWFNCRALCLKI